MKIISVEAQVFHAQTEAIGRNGTHNELNSRFLHFWDSLNKILNLLLNPKSH